MKTNINPFPSFYEEFIFKSRYSKYLEDQNRRENWDETINRYLDFMQEKVGFDSKTRSDVFDKIYKLEVMPSMRSVMTAGKALERSNIAGYNCCYIPCDDPKSFDEAMYILMNGTGVGYSVERQFVVKLPEIPEKLFESETTVVVKDSKEGWAKSLRQIIALLYSGEIPKWDVSKVRPAGERLKTFGGRASGPGPLEELFRFTVEKFRNAQGRKLTSIECHDIFCKIGEVVVVGGVRRSAMISLSNLSDDRMRTAKSGAWWDTEPQRALANNSASYTEKPDTGVFMKEWLSLYESKSGERGIFNRQAATKQAQKNGRRDPDFEWGTNPCSEIILRPYQFCNLSEVVVRENDTFETLKEKIRIATIIGTWQASLTDFPYLRKIWKTNTEEEALLGVSLTGIFDSLLTSNGDVKLLEELKQFAVDTNKKEAKRIGINQSTAITCVKPSGTVSQLVDSASGIHPRYAPYYVRTVRGDNKDPVTEFLKSQGIPNEPCKFNSKTTTVFSFPIKSPEKSIVRKDVSPIEHLEIWKRYQDSWCEHKPSVTIDVQEHQWPSVGGWVYDNFDSISGVSFLPNDNHTYEQAPYQEITKDQYEEFKEKMPKVVDWNLLSEFEKEDNTTGMQTMACSADSCEIVDLT